MSREDKLYLQHVYDAIKDIERYTKGLTAKDFNGNKLVQDAVIRNLEIIGEATKRLSKEFKKKYSDIEWRKMVGMRDVLIHDYLGVDAEVVWAVCKNRLPDLKKKIKKILD